LPDRAILLAGALLAAIGVALGAFGAHALRAMLSAERLDWWQTATLYQMWHALALVALSVVAVSRARLVAIFLGGGAAVFSGSLYAMTLTGWLWLGMLTPLGGVAMIAGWLLLAWQALRETELSRD
jgi:uncharacterized membrane protein YgdD (TMEM256/DUF423 family)